MVKRYNKPVKLTDSLQNINKNLVYKFGNISYIIYSKWAEIVGSFFVQHSQPDKITILKTSSEDYDIEFQKKTLHVSVAPAAALEFQHFQNKILEKINSFFGYKAIHYIKIHQNFISKKTRTSSKIISKLDNNLLNNKKNEIKDTTQKINDKELEKSLLNLGLSIVKNEEN